MKWITRERPKIDRIACPWLIQKFVDTKAEFLYAAKDQVMSSAKELGATPYDVNGVELAHHGDFCSFDAIIIKYKIADSAVLKMAEIVRAADTDNLGKSPQAPGLLAITLRLSALHQNDHEMLKVGMQIYEALYVWCQSLEKERHNWNPLAI